MKPGSSLLTRISVWLLVLTLSLVTVAACAQPASAPSPSPAATPSTPAPAAQITIKVAHQWAVDDFSAAGWVYPILRFVEAKAKGRVKFDVYPAGQLLKGADLLRGLRDKVADITFTPTGYVAGELPLSSGLDLPFANRDIVDYVWHHQKVNELPEVQAELQKWKVRPLLMCPPGAYSWLTKDKQIRTLADLKGLRMRVVGGLDAKAMQLLGSTPVNIATPEVYTALQRGTCDGTMSGAPTLLSYRYNEVAKYLTLVAMTTPAGWLAINSDTWNNLPKDIQGIFDESAAEAQTYSLGWHWWGERKALQELQGKGVVVYTLPDSEKNKALEIVAPMFDDFAKANGAAGKKIVDIMKMHF